MNSLLNIRRKVNAMTLAYAAKLGLSFRKTSVGTQKIDGLVLDTYKMVIADFSVHDKLKRV